MAKVIPLSDPPAIVNVVKELEQHVKDDTVSEAVLIYRTKPRNKDEKGRIHRYWFGDNSTIMPLGLAHHMCTVIEDYIREQNFILEEDEDFIDDN